MTKIRGGSAAIGVLSAALADMARLVEEIRENPANVRLIALDADLLLEAIDLLRDWRDATLAPMLERREKAGQADLDDLLSRLSRVEQAIVALQSASGQAPIVRLDERRGQDGGR